MLKFGFRIYRKCNRSQLGSFCKKRLRRRAQIFVWNKSFVIGLLWTHTLIFQNLVLFSWNTFSYFYFAILNLESWILNLESWISSQIVFNNVKQKGKDLDTLCSDDQKYKFKFGKKEVPYKIYHEMLLNAVIWYRNSLP